ncbi:MAG: Manganese transport system membrane protein MntB [Chlamydiales bacterium]|nr:Manganese transport system membrane protein MntB [Chlamydiales bacterium]MCH9619293.1 Manganese transport system membrane protein MntB [Chlamydiales bacterium]MCH9622555.1 Manganese transport system membrane protein MntB [Chlamydiales bacterium]
MNFLEALLSTPLLQMSFLAIIGTSIASGTLGCYVVVKRIVSISGSIAHSVLSGLGCALFLQRTYGLDWLLPIYGALVAAIISALIIGFVHLYYKQREDTVIAMVWSIGMATGVIFASMTPGFNVELMNFLLGNVLWVSGTDLIILLVLDLIILLSIFIFHKKFLAICFDEKQAKLQGLPVARLYIFLLTLVALSIVLLIHTVGIILVLSMLALPPSIAEKFAYRLSTMMVASVVLNILFSLGGMAISYRLNWPVGATIALFSGVIYLLSIRFKKPMSSLTP